MYSENEDFNDEYEESTNNNASLGDKLKDFYESNKKMVIILLGLLLLLIMLLMMNSCSNNNAGTTNGNNEKIKILITPTENYLNVGNSIQLIASIDPVDAYENPNYTWESSDETVAIVDSLGNVNALKLGKTTITVSFMDDENKPYSETCEVNVIEGNKDIVATNVMFPEGEILITRGDKYQLSKQVTPSNGYIENVVYTSSDTSIVEVDANGTIKALSDGVATIKMSVNNGNFNDEIVVNVVSDNVEPQIIINPITIVFDSKEISIAEGDTKKLTYQYLPTTAYVGDLEWSTSDEKIAQISDDGVVTAISSGTAVITVKTRTGITDTVSIKVEKGVVKVTSIEIVSSKNLTMNINDTSTIVSNVLPSDATNKTVSYSSSNTSVAKVDSTGVIRALSQGSAVITVTTNDGNIKETVNVTVNGSGSSGSSGSSGGSSSICDAENLIRISSDSGGAITSEEGGTSNVATKSVITIETDSIGKNSSCAEIEEVKYCYQKYEDSDCIPTTVFNVGDSITMNVPAGEGIMQIRIKATLTNNQELTKTYYMKYNVEGNGSNDSSNSSSGSNGLNYEYQGTEHKGLGLGNVVFGKIKYSLTKNASSINYCLSSVGSTTCTATGNASSAYRTTTTYAGTSGYRLLNANVLYRQGYINSGKSSDTLYIGAWEGQYFCMTPNYADGTTGSRQCVLVTAK